MANQYITLPGEHINPEELKLREATELAGFLASGISNFTKLIECMIDDGSEVIIFDLDIEMGQHSVNDIMRTERIAVKFFDAKTLPEVLALRSDFPKVPHTNLRPEEKPISLCLFDERYEDIKLYWTPAFFVQRVSEWLSMTARGQLHQIDQPLEPLLNSSGCQIIVPFDLFKRSTTKSSDLKISCINNPHSKMITLRATYDNPSDKCGEYIPFPIIGETQVHGIIRHQPQTLQDLHELLTNINVNLKGDLSSYLKTVITENKYDAYKASQLILIVGFPKKRYEDSVPEKIDVWAFLIPVMISQLGEILGIWAITNGIPGLLLSSIEKKEKIDVLAANVIFSVERETAAILNGFIKGDRRKIVIIGVGALGSQVFMNLIRAGFGSWTLIDEDCLLPHNLSRHVLTGHFIGFPKAEKLSNLANTVFDGEKISTFIVADVLCPGGNKEAVYKALGEAEVILDISTSIAVARFISIDVSASGRRTSLFLNPTGHHSVLLIEDANRKITLDCIEMQYYRLLISEPKLNKHLFAGENKMRYANSCRDVTSFISQDMICIHSGILSRTLRTSLENVQSCIAIWMINPQGLTVDSIMYRPEEIITFESNGWTVLMDNYIISKLYLLRKDRLPCETGGVLIGSFDMARRLIYIVETISSPPDSIEWPISYIRGCSGLSSEIEKILAITDRRLGYVGEWHSHPDGCELFPSSDDARAFEWLSGYMRIDGLPATMMIVGQGDHQVYVEKLSI